MRELLAAMTSLLAEIKQGRLATPDSKLNEKAKEIAEVIEDTKTDIGQKLKISLPIIPRILTYETGVEMVGGVNVQSAWKHLMAKLRKTTTETTKDKK